MSILKFSDFLLEQKRKEKIAVAMRAALSDMSKHLRDEDVKLGSDEHFNIWNVSPQSLNTKKTKALNKKLFDKMKKDKK